LPIATPVIGFQIPNVVDPDGDGTVCVTLTTGSGGNKVFDAAPDADHNPSCMPINANPPGFSGFS
jgi:hypothetical protein